MAYTDSDSRTPIRVLIVEDEIIFRRGLRAELERFAAEVEIVGEAANARDAVDRVRALDPDLVLFDLRVPEYRGLTRIDEKYGLAAIEQITDLSPDTHVLVLSTIESPHTLFEALHAGAQGYVTKSDSYDGEKLVDAIQKTMNGQTIYGPMMAQHIREYQQSGYRSSAPIHSLTPRELEVVDLVLEGKSDKEIAAKLIISPRTVQDHVANILHKLNLKSRHQIAFYMALHGHRRKRP